MNRISLDAKSRKLLYMIIVLIGVWIVLETPMIAQTFANVFISRISGNTDTVVFYRTFEHYIIGFRWIGIIIFSVGCYGVVKK